MGYAKKKKKERKLQVIMPIVAFKMFWKLKYLAIAVIFIC